MKEKEETEETEENKSKKMGKKVSRNRTEEERNLIHIDEDCYILILKES